MVAFHSHVQHAEQYMGPDAGRLLCLPDESQAAQIHLVDVGPAGDRDRRNAYRLAQTEMPLSLPPMESDPTSSQQGTSGKVPGSANHTQPVQRNMVSNSLQAGNSSSHAYKSYGYHLRKRRRVVPSGGQQQLDFPGLEDPRIAERPRPSGVSSAVEALLAQAPAPHQLAQDSSSLYQMV